MWALLLGFIWFLIIGLLAAFVAWLLVANSHYTGKLLGPGQSYMIEDRRYIFPNVETTGPTYLLKTSYIRSLRQLLTMTGDLLDELGIDWWITGGTLIGAVQFKAIPMPFDDDIDIGVDDDLHRKYLFSEQFAEEAKKAGLIARYFQGASSSWAERTGACVRLQMPKRSETLDIFFWKKFKADGKVIKLDGWGRDGSVVKNTKEQFDWNDVYPLQKNAELDGLHVNMTANPHRVLVQQYGPKVTDRVIARSLEVSHLFPMLTLDRLFITRAPG